MGKGATRKEGIYQHDEKKTYCGSERAHPQGMCYRFSTISFPYFFVKFLTICTKAVNCPSEMRREGQLAHVPTALKRESSFLPFPPLAPISFPFSGAPLMSPFMRKSSLLPSPPPFPSFYIACPRNPRGDLRCSPLLLLLVVKVVPCAKKENWVGIFWCLFLSENSGEKKSWKEMLCARRRQLALKWGS